MTFYFAVSSIRSVADTEPASTTGYVDGWGSAHPAHLDLAVIASLLQPQAPALAASSIRSVADTEPASTTGYVDGWGSAHPAHVDLAVIASLLQPHGEVAF